MPAPFMHVLLDCPDCGLPAEPTDRFTLKGGAGPVAYLRLACVAGHVHTVPAAMLDGATGIRMWGPRRLLARVRELWNECNYARRRALEIQAGASLTKAR
jgi:hypothetical protein